MRWSVQTGDEPIDIAFDQRADAGIDGCQHAAFVFARLRPHVAGQLDAQVHAAASDGITRSPLVRCDCGSCAGTRRWRSQRRRPAVRAAARTTASVSSGSTSCPSASMRPPISRTSARGTNGCGRREFEPHRVRHGKALQFEQVAEAGGNQQADARALALDQRIGRDRAAVGVDDALPRRLIALEGRLDLIDATEDAGAGPRRVLGTLKQCSSPELVISARSVNVPPTSVPRKLDAAIMSRALGNSRGMPTPQAVSPSSWPAQAGHPRLCFVPLAPLISQQP